MKFILVILCAVFVASCALAPKVLREEDIEEWTELDLPVNYQEAYRTLKNGFRACNNLNSSGPSRLHTDSDLYTDIEKAKFDVYFYNSFFEKTFALGFINIKATGKEQSHVAIGIKRGFDKGKYWTKILSSWAKGTYKCLE